MKNIYNKGRFRGGEWAKHLRPFLKRMANKRWRHSVRKMILEDEQEVASQPISVPKKKPKKSIEVQFKLRSFHDTVHTYRVKYRTMRAAQDAMKRNCVVRAEIIKKNVS